MAESGQHILGTFNDSLVKLKSDLLMMASLAERSLHNAMTGLFQRDDQMCNGVIADDEEIDQLEKQADNDGIELRRRFQPVATDLRAVVAGLKLSGNLERIADQGVNIAKRARQLNRRPLLGELHLLQPLFDEALGMLTDSLRAFSEGGLDLAMSIKPRDKKLDELNLQLAGHLTELMTKTPDRVTDYLNLIFIARHLERVGDHAKNIAEEVVYALAAEDIRHTR